MGSFAQKKSLGEAAQGVHLDASQPCDSLANYGRPWDTSGQDASRTLRQQPRQRRARRFVDAKRMLRGCCADDTQVALHNWLCTISRFAQDASQK